jgi:hypothetical protein
MNIYLYIFTCIYTGIDSTDREDSSETLDKIGKAQHHMSLVGVVDIGVVHTGIYIYMYSSKYIHVDTYVYICICMYINTI